MGCPIVIQPPILLDEGVDSVEQYFEDKSCDNGGWDMSYDALGDKNTSLSPGGYLLF